jgi:hypothetical protein
METEPQPRRLILKKMPTQEMLEEFVNQMHGAERRQVHFNTITGEFEWKESIDARPISSKQSYGDKPTDNV